MDWMGNTTGMTSFVCDHASVKWILSILQVPDTGTFQYWWILEHFWCNSMLETMIFTFFRTCWRYAQTYNTGMQKWSSIVQYSCTSIWDLKYTFSHLHIQYISNFKVLNTNPTEKKEIKKKDNISQGELSISQL